MMSNSAKEKDTANCLAELPGLVQIKSLEAVDKKNEVTILGLLERCAVALERMATAAEKKPTGGGDPTGGRLYSSNHILRFMKDEQEFETLMSALVSAKRKMRQTSISTYEIMHAIRTDKKLPDDVGLAMHDMMNEARCERLHVKPNVNGEQQRVKSWEILPL